MRDCHSHCISALQEGREPSDGEKVSVSFFLRHISLKGKVREGGAEKKTEPLAPRSRESAHMEYPAVTRDSNIETARIRTVRPMI